MTAKPSMRKFVKAANGHWKPHFWEGAFGEYNQQARLGLVSSKYQRLDACQRRDA
jgi:hypothetical protein